MVVWTLPITDESFYNIVGNEISRTILVQQMIDYYNEKLEIQRGNDIKWLNEL